MTTRTYALGLIVALLLLLALRLPMLRCGPLEADVIKHYDEINYIWLANSLANGDTEADTRWAWMRAPGPALILLPFMVLRNMPAELVICEYQLVQTALWAITTLLVAAVTAALFGRRAALIAALIVAIFPLAGFLTLIVYSDALFCFGLVLNVAALFQNSRQPHPGWLALAGFAAGFAALSRSTILPLLPILAVWAMNFQYDRWSLRNWRSSAPRIKSAIANAISAIPTLKPHIVAGLLFLGCCTLVIAPWTIRNYVVHGGLIVIDTTGAHNLWADNKISDVTVTSVVWAYSQNPVERQRYAARRAREDITADPERFVRKVAYNMAESWRPLELNSAWGRWFKILQNTRTFPSALLGQLDTALSVTLPLTLLGLLFAPQSAPGSQQYRVVVVGLALCFMLITGITHYEDRYRLPFMLVMLPYAAWCMAHPRALLAQLRRPVGIAALVLVLALGGYYAHYIWPAQWLNARALVLHSRGLLREHWGYVDGALADQRAAAELQPRLQESYIAAARLVAKQDDLTQAQTLLREAPKASKLTADIIVPSQQLLLRQGYTEEAAALDGQHNIPGRRRAEELAWQAGKPAQPTLDMGVNDFGLVKGFYVRERGDTGFFRWSRPEAQMLLAGPGDHACLHLNAARPPSIPAPVVTISAVLDGSPVELGQIHPARQGWTWGCVPIPADRTADQVELHLRTPVFNPHVYSGNRDTRNLGVVVDQVALRYGPLTIDPATGLLLDYQPPSATAPLTLMGLNGELAGQPGDMLPLTLWWRGEQPPSDGVFTFLHLLNEQGDRVAEYNAPLANGQLPSPWVAAEPLPDQAALSLPADLDLGTYRLVGGAFDPTSGTTLASAELGEVQVSLPAQGSTVGDGPWTIDDGLSSIVHGPSTDKEML